MSSDRPVIVGAGLAGLLTALRLAPAPCLVLSAGPLGAGSSTGLAQGGIAAAVAPGDSAALHALDTLAAGAGLGERKAIERVTGGAAEALAYLVDLGAELDRDDDGALLLGLEGAHSRHRIAHAGGDATGRELLRAATAAVRRTPSVMVLEHARAVRVVVEDGAVRRLEVVLQGDQPAFLPTDRVVLATGGIGGLFAHSTNPSSSRGQGLALAARAGAVLRDLEMVQFHPTALDVGLRPMPLVSEALRGAGARLVDASGRDLPGDPLASRDVVARRVWTHLADGGRAFLDARDVPDVAEHFPTVTAACRTAGIDPARDLLPVRPAAHYQMGGVAVDEHGRSTVPGLWAVGEVASTGLHGANRLASNSLLEAAVCSRWVAEDVDRGRPGRNDQRDHGGALLHPDRDGRSRGGERRSSSLPRPVPHPARSGPAQDTPDALDLAEVRGLVSSAVGVVRDGPTLTAARDRLRAAHLADPDDDDTLVALLLVTGALRREESRGAHHRTDHPSPAPAAHQDLTLADAYDHALEWSTA
ncbi:L-aspartate oxidase [Georgenia sp. Z1344]|uniref:L-aspartate oxidase n=1 Tax=Georgenia sp. Z1344 TaxID=3416706 RepID=UPI003CF04187